LYYFNQACFKSNRTSENHVRKGKKEEGKNKVLRNKESSLSSEKKKNIFFVFFFAKTIGFVWCTSLVLFFINQLKQKSGNLGDNRKIDWIVNYSKIDRVKIAFINFL